MTTHCLRSIIVAMLTLTILCTSATAGVEIVEIRKVQIAKGLTGIVCDPSGTPLPGVQVEEVSSDWQTVLQTTSTGANGHFTIKPTSREKMYYLVFYLKNFNPMRIRVKIRSDSKRELSLRLEFGT